MAVYNLSKKFSWDVGISEKAAGVMKMFGLTVEALEEKGVIHSCQLEIAAGDVVYITGASGSGKSVLLRELELAIPADERVNLNEIELADDRALVDCFDGDFLQNLKVLNSAGLNDCFCVLNKPVNLSEGQQYRFRLAMALAAGKGFIFADEFCSNLDRITAAVIAYNVQKFAKRHKVVFVLASSHEDILVDLSADVVVYKELSGESKVSYKNGGGRRAEL